MTLRTRAVTACAFIVTRGHTPFLRHAVASVRAQTLRPTRCAIVDVSAPDDPAHLTRDDVATLTGGVYLIEAPEATLGRALMRALAALKPDDDLMWILHDDCAPAPDCLAHLVDTLAEDPTIAVAGPKQCRWDDDAYLLEVGIVATASGRRLDVIDPGEIDQGQHDRTGDVLAVGTAGMVVSLSVWRELGGIDPNLGPFGDGWEMCRRVRLAGHRVVVVPEARVRHARAGLEGLRAIAAHTPPAPARLAELAERDADPGDLAAAEADDDGPVDHVDLRRRSLRLREGDPTRALLARARRDRSLRARRASEAYLWALTTPGLALPGVLVALLILGFARALRAIVTKQPRVALIEAATPVRLLARLDRVMARRRHIRGVAHISRTRLRPYQAGAFEMRSHRALARKVRRDATAPDPLDPLAAQALADYRRRATRTLLAVMAGAAVVTAWAFHGLWAGVTGGAFATLPSSWTALADASSSAWVSGGDGTPGPARPLLFLLTIASAPWAAVGVSPTAWWEISILLAPMGAALTAWVGVGAWVRSLPARAFVALAWAVWPSLWSSLYAGEVGSVAVHVALPVAAWGLANATALTAPDRLPGADGEVVYRRRRGEWCGAGVAALALAWIAAAHPVTGGLLAAVGVGAGGIQAWRHRRMRLALRGLLAPLPALILLAPSLLTAVTHSHVGAYVWAAPQAPRVLPGGDGVAVAIGSTLDLHPLAELWAELAPAWQVGAAATSALTWFAAVTALVRRERAWATRGAWVGLLCCWGLLLLAPAGATLAPLLSCGGAMLLAAACGWAGASRSRPGAWIGLPALAAALALVATGLSWAALGPRVGEVDGLIEASPRATRLPLAAQLRQSGPAKARVLVLGTNGTAVTANLWRGLGTSLTDATDARASAPGAAGSDLADALARLTRAGESTIVDTLAAHGIDEIVVDRVSTHDELVAALDAVEGLTRVTRTASVLAWRVNGDDVKPRGAPARAWIDDGNTRRRVDAGQAQVSTTVAAAPGERTLVLAERAGRGWHARLGGQDLPATTRGWAQAFTIPAGASGNLSVSYGPGWWPWWRAGVAVALLSAALAAVPGRRRADV